MSLTATAACGASSRYPKHNRRDDIGAGEEDHSMRSACPSVLTRPRPVADIEARRARVAWMVPLSIRLILDTDKEQNALKVLARFKKLNFVLRGLAPYFKGEFEANIVARLDDGPWPSVVLRSIEVAQSFAKGCLIGGAVQEEIDLSASEGFAVPGIQFAWITARRNDR